MSAHAREVPLGTIEPRGVDEILAALSLLEPGEHMVYHCGDLANDRRRGRRDFADVDHVANRAFELARGPFPRVHLTQFRRGHDKFAYVAMGAGNWRPRPRAAV